MRTRTFRLFFAFAFFVFCADGYASSFEVSIDTSTLFAQNGGIYFQFAPGLNADAASVSITDFLLTPPGALNPTSALNFSDGGASGTLDTQNLSISNDFALNDFGEALTFGKEISFNVSLNLPSVLRGDSGSELDIQVTGPDLLEPLLTSDPTGNAAEISYDQNGSVSVISTTDAVTVKEISNVPEPGGLMLEATAMAMLALSALRRRGQKIYSEPRNR